MSQNPQESKVDTSKGAATARRVGLDREDVVDAALALVEGEGAAALTMRRLAAELDVTTTTIYWHAGGRDELVMALIAVFVAGLMVGRTPEYLGKKVEAREIKLAMLAVLILPLSILGFSAVSAVLPVALKG